MIRGDYFHYEYFMRSNSWNIDIKHRKKDKERAIPCLTKKGIKQYSSPNGYSSFNTKWEFELASGTKMLIGHALYYLSEK